MPLGHGTNRLTALCWAPLALCLCLWAPVCSAQAVADPPEPTLADLVRLVEEQGRALAGQRREIDALRQELEETKQLSLSAHNRLEDVAGQATPQPPVKAPVDERAKKAAESAEVLDIPADVVTAGDFPGSLRVPGTDMEIRLAGLVRTTGVNTFGPLGTEDRFVTSSIPVEGSAGAGKDSRFVLSAAPSRFNLDLRTPTGVGAMRAFIEGDFAGGGKTLRLRHAYGQWKGLVVGQTWSTFADPEAEPDGIDFEGLNAIALFRQPQVRYTQRFGKSFSLAGSLENPAPDVTNAEGVSQVPDVVVRARWRPGKEDELLGMRLFREDAHVNLAFLLRQIRAEPLDQANATLSAGGYGVGLSGRLTAPWQTDHAQITFSAYAGKGIGRYITDLGSLGGQDAYYDPVTGVMEALPAFAWYVGYGRKWTTEFRSTFTYGTVLVDNLDAQPGDSLHQTDRGSFNLTWSPIPRLDLVAEFLLGHRIDKDGKRGFSSQLQLGANFRF